MKASLGLDFGTESVRAVLVDLRGREMASAVAKYAHGQIVELLRDGGVPVTKFVATGGHRITIRSSYRSMRMCSAKTLLSIRTSKAPRSEPQFSARSPLVRLRHRARRFARWRPGRARRFTNRIASIAALTIRSTANIGDSAISWQLSPSHDAFRFHYTYSFRRERAWKAGPQIYGPPASAARLVSPNGDSFNGVG